MSGRHKIALFADHGSKQLQTLHEIIDREGGEPLSFDIQLGGPRAPALSFGQGLASWQGVDFSDIHAVHIRCTAPNSLPMPPPVLNPVTHAERRLEFLREQHYQAASHAFFDVLSSRGTLVANSLMQGYIEHDSKAQLSEKLRAWGFDTPVTLTTNDANRVREFAAVHDEVIYKPQIGVGPARLLSPEDLTRLEHDMPQCPVLLQERVRGETVRVHVVGETMVLALRILTNNEVDSRTATQGFEYFPMPAADGERIAHATRRLGLHYAAWDVIVTDAGKVVYLDCNPGPYLMWIGERNVDGVLTQLARYLLRYCDTRSLEDARSAVEPVPTARH